MEITKAVQSKIPAGFCYNRLMDLWSFVFDLHVFVLLFREKEALTTYDPLLQLPLINEHPDFLDLRLQESALQAKLGDFDLAITVCV